jgi:hypothetical protein
VVHPTETLPTPSSKAPPRVSLQLGFGGSLDGNAVEPGYFGSALVDVAVDARRRVGVGLDFELQDNLSVQGPTAAPGSLSIQREVLRIFGRYAFNPDHGIRLLVGAGVERFAASPSGFSTNTPMIVFDPELWVSAFWLQPIWKRLYFFGQAGVSVQLEQERFQITQEPGGAETPLAVLSPVWMTLTAGLGAYLF